MADQTSASQPPEPSAAAAYIADIAAGLAAMARRQKFDALGYLLEMARLEAEAISNSARRRRRE
ncbi:MAG: hypothetical protein R3D62_07755 [Xanthobacteraceae bacterium]